ncbi:MAG: PfkB family carbohydrate kinase [Candidatus Bathyarchaeia archaeon]
MASDIVVVGHLCIDSINLPNRQITYMILGGSAAYASLSAKHLGANVSIISKVGGDFPKAYLWWLNQEGIDTANVHRVEQEKTTRFELKYSNDLSTRTLRLIYKAPPINIEDIPNFLEAKAIHLAPIANEIQYDVAEKLKRSADLMALDPQGLVRAFNGEGFVHHETLKEKRILELIDIYKSSEEEIEAVTGIADLRAAIRAVHDFGVEIVIVTLGMKGAVLSIDGTVYEVPVYTPNKIVDPTGAGDAFMGGFLAEYFHNKEVLWCACIGSAAASTVVEGIGPTLVGSESEIRRRAEALYEKGIKH